MSQVFYIHGFGSSPQSETLKKLRESFPDAIGLTYDPLDPFVSLRKLHMEILSAEDYPVIVGSSLGGWYADQLSKSVVGDFILYNPSISPEVSLSRYNIPREVLYKYKLRAAAPRGASRTIVLSMDDEIFDAKLTEKQYSKYADIIKTSGGHRMTDDNLSIIVKKIKYLDSQLP